MSGPRRGEVILLLRHETHVTMDLPHEVGIRVLILSHHWAQDVGQLSGPSRAAPPYLGRKP